MERLCGIGQVELGEQLVVPQAYLTTLRLTGRDDALQRVRRMVLRCPSGSGAPILVLGEEGLGRSRFVDSCALEGKLAGAWVARAGASDAIAQFAVAHALVQRIHEAAGGKLPAPPALTERGGDEETDTPSDVQNAGSAHQAALLQWVLQATDLRAVMLVIDDMDRINARSAALLALLADQARQRRLVVVAAALPDNDERAEALRFFAAQAHVEVMRPFAAADPQEVVSAVSRALCRVGDQVATRVGFHNKAG